MKTALIGLQQARAARYETAADTRASPNRASPPSKAASPTASPPWPPVIQAQKDLAQNRDAEIQAMANYTHAKIAFDLALGRTLDVNHISLEEAIAEPGTVANPSSPIRSPPRAAKRSCEMESRAQIPRPALPRHPARRADAAFLRRTGPRFGSFDPQPLSRPQTVPAVRLYNSEAPRHPALRAGKLYLTVQRTRSPSRWRIISAWKSISRYGPLLAQTGPPAARAGAAARCAACRAPAPQVSSVNMPASA